MTLLVLDFCHLVNILTNTNDILKVDLCHLANTLANTNSTSKVDSCYLANTLTNTNDKADEFTKEKVLLHPTDNLLLIIK